MKAQCWNKDKEGNVSEEAKEVEEVLIFMASFGSNQKLGALGSLTVVVPTIYQGIEVSSSILKTLHIKASG